MLGIFLDTETNGLNIRKHVILELALKIVDLETGQEKAAYETLLSVTEDEWARSDPASLKVNGFTREKTLGGITRSALREELLILFHRWDIKRGKAVFICQNPSFDRVFFGQIVNPDEQEKLLWPYHWLDLASMYWAKAIQEGTTDPEKFPWVTGFSKDKIASACNLPPEEKPHRAMNGVNHLILCYETVVGFPLTLH